jgi:hypothetical protein
MMLMNFENGGSTVYADVRAVCTLLPVSTWVTNDQTENLVTWPLQNLKVSRCHWQCALVNLHNTIETSGHLQESRRAVYRPNRN